LIIRKQAALDLGQVALIHRNALGQLVKRISPVRSPLANKGQSVSRFLGHAALSPEWIVSGIVI
jgi:hypothetical protein